MPFHAPSPRNLQIYLDYQVEGLTQTELAEKYNLAQCRVSQIIRRIDTWRSSSQIPNPKSEIPNSSPVDSQSPSPEPPSSAADSALPTPHSALSPSALDLHLQSARLNLVAREAIRHFQQPQATVTHKQGTRGDKSIDETTTRNLPKNLQCLKIILQANNQQQRLSRAPSSCPSLPVPLSPPPQTCQPSESEHNISRDEVTSWLASQHRQAENDEKVFFSGNSVHLASDLLKLLLGEAHTGLALRLLAAFDGKKVVNYSPRDENWPEVPPYNGWYYAMYDAHGTVVAYLHADQVAHLLPPDYPPTLAKSGGLPRSECPPLKILPLATIESSPTNETANRHTPEILPLPLGEGRGEGVSTVESVGWDQRAQLAPAHHAPTSSAKSAPEILPLPLGEGRGEGAWRGSTSSTSASSTKFTQPQSPPPLTPLLPPITIFPPLLPA